jgi:hypothetical protein
MTKWGWTALAVCAIAAAIYLLLRHIDYGPIVCTQALEGKCIRWEMENYARKSLIIPNAR